jgi:hypothetical protein
MMIPRALKFVRYDRVQSHLEAGWIVSIPNAAMHHHHYGIELAWLCACPVPGGFGEETVSNRVPNPQAESIEHGSQHRA